LPLGRRETVDDHTRELLRNLRNYLKGAKWNQKGRRPAARAGQPPLISRKKSASIDVRFRGNSGHDSAVLRCPLLTQSGHERPKIAAMQLDLWTPFRRPQIPAV